LQCDEVQPKCGYCAKRDLTCTFIPKSAQASQFTPTSSQTSSTPSRDPSDIGGGEIKEIVVSWELVKSPKSPTVSILSSSGELSPTDMRLMHHWSTMTWDKVAIGDEANQALLLAVPQLAFENDFLLNGLLGVASMHLQKLNPSSDAHRRQTDIYRGKCLTSYRKTLTKVTKFKDRSPLYEAALVMSVLLVVLYTQDPTYDPDELVVIKWVIM
jgi:hypothetical protein